MTKEILIKRVESLFGKIPPPVFKTEIEDTAYRLTYELRSKINVTWVLEETNYFSNDVELPSNWDKLTKYEKAAYIIDDSEICREAFKRCWYKQKENPK